jgi:hypothetical protein
MPQNVHVNQNSANEQKRASERHRRLLKAQMIHPRHGKIDIVVRDVSAQGIGGKCQLDLVPTHDPVAGRIAWCAKRSFGVKLDDGVDPAEVRISSDSGAEPYQAPERAQPAGDFKRPGFGRNRGR